MFHDTPEAIVERMRVLENLNATDRQDGTATFERLRQVPPATGRFLAIVAASAPEGAFIEIGTSGGYSGLWLSLACRATGRTLTTFEMSPAKIEIATATFEAGGVDDIVTIVPGDAREHLADHDAIAFCFLDAEKDAYQECYDLVVPRMVGGGLLVADNVISHEDVLKDMVDRAIADERIDALVVPIGSGLLLGRKI